MATFENKKKELAPFNEITINNSIMERFNIKSADHVFEFLSPLVNKIYVVARESETAEHKEHFHVLTNELTEKQKKALWDLNIYNATIKDLVAFELYIKKENKIKLYNDYKLISGETKKESKMEKLKYAIFYEKLSKQEIMLEYFDLYLKYKYTIDTMINERESSLYTKYLTKY